MLAALLATLAPRPAAAQVKVLDEGSFTISERGARIGREEFRIRSTPGPQGGLVVASATVAYEERRLVPILRTDSAGTPLEYMVEQRRGTRTEEKLSGTVSRGRVSVRVQSPRGEAAREFAVAEGATVLEDEVFHQYFFLARAARRGDVPVIVPRRHAQVVVRVEQVGAETVVIGDRTISATRLRISEPESPTREVWVDDGGRVLRVTIPDRGIVAMRDDPPR